MHYFTASMREAAGDEGIIPEKFLLQHPKNWGAVADPDSPVLLLLCAPSVSVSLNRHGDVWSLPWFGSKLLVRIV